MENTIKRGTVYIYYIGCHILRYEIRRISLFVRQNGFEESNDPATADYIIIAGCGVVDLVENSSLQKIFNACEVAKTTAIKIVYGGIAEVAEQKLKNRGLIIIKYGEELKFNEIFDTNIKIDDIIPETNENGMYDVDVEFKSHPRPLSFERNNQKELCAYLDKLHNTNSFTDAFTKSNDFNGHLCWEKDIFEVKLGTGCLGNCSYCVINKFRGSLKSVSREKVIASIYSGIRNGYKKFIFLAEEVGYWGLDINDDLCNLLDEIEYIRNKEKKAIQLYIPCLHPDKLIKSYERLLPHLLSGLICELRFDIQTGSHKIIKLMNRRTDLKKLKFILNDMYQKRVPTYLFTQIISNFPGETLNDLYDTIDFFTDTHFDTIQISPFSARPGTPAAKFKGQIPSSEGERRNRLLRLYFNNFRSKQLLHRITTIFDTLQKQNNKK